MKGITYRNYAERIAKVTDNDAKRLFLTLDERTKMLVARFTADRLHRNERLRSRGESVPKFVVDLDAMTNLINYTSVWAYESPELAEREKKRDSLPATLFELKMGCYLEQIESQTRAALVTLRKKGYNTIESGYHDEFIGSQFFHFDGSDQELISTIDFEKINDWIGGVEIEIRNGPNPHLFLVSTKVLNPNEWEEVLNVLSEKMPEIRQTEVVTVTGASIDFAFEQTQILPKEHFLRMAKCAADKDYINSLYECESRDEVETLYKEVNSFYFGC